MPDQETNTENRSAAGILLLVALLTVGAFLAARSNESIVPSAKADLTPPSYSDCVAADTVQPFAAYGDNQDYVPVPNGSFEDGLNGWTVSKGSAELVPGTNPDGTSGNALQLDEGTKVLSPPICFDETRPHARMFVLKNGAKQSLDMEVHFPEFPSGQTEDIDVNGVDRDLPVTSDWAPSPEIGTGLSGIKQLILPDADGHRWFQFEIETKDKGTWKIDDLYVDPRGRN